MNRRELLERVSTLAAVTGVPGVAVSAVPEPAVAESRVAAFVIEAPGALSMDLCDRLTKTLQEWIDDGPFAGAKALVLAEGLKLTVLDSNGRAVNLRVEQGDADA